PIPPTPFKGGGEIHLGYELHITNFSRNPCVLTKVDVKNDAQVKVLASYSGDDLGGRIARPGLAATTTEEKLKVGPGLRMVVYVWLTFASPADVPAVLRHQLTFKVGDYPDELSVETSRLPVSNAQLVI